MEIKSLSRKAFLVLVPLAALSGFFFGWKKTPAGVLVGGVLGLANLKAMSWGVKGLLGTDRATGKLVFFSMLRFIAIFALLLVLLRLALVNLAGVIAGFTVVFALVLFEGMRQAGKEP